MFQHIIMFNFVLKFSQNYVIFKKNMSLFFKVFEIMKTLVTLFF